MSRSRIVLPFLVIGPLSAIVGRQLRPTLEGWWAAFRSDVEGWLTWRDLGAVLLGSLWCGFMVYLLVGDAAAAISRRFGGGAMTTGAMRTLQVIATIIAFPLALWAGLALSHGEKTWAWNEPVFSVISTSPPPVDNGAIAPRARDAEAPAEPERIPLPPSLQSRPIILRPQYTAELLDRYGGAQPVSYEGLSRAARLADAAGDVYGPLHAEYLHYAAQTALTARMAGDEAAAIAIAAATAPAVAAVSDIFRRATEPSARNAATPAGLK